MSEDAQRKPVTWKDRLKNVVAISLAILFVFAFISYQIADNLFSAFMQIPHYIPETRIPVLIIGLIVMSITIFFAVQIKLEKWLTKQDAK
jgi:hypothetical protein